MRRSVSAKTETGNTVRVWAVALLTTFVVFATSYKLLLWDLISYWEWQHDGRRMKFTFWADERALPLALFVSGISLFLTLKYLRKRQASN
ncbi:MAG: hypothetical protein JWO13_3475 [Acidobacteriales bacterium]|nr:hypothetical protein [Terriglobales bacterium]